MNLLRFVAAGFATAELDLDDEAVIRWRGFIPPVQRGSGGGYLVDASFFARYRYRWGQEDFLLYVVVCVSFCAIKRTFTIVSHRKLASIDNHSENWLLRNAIHP